MSDEEKYIRSDLLKATIENVRQYIRTVESASERLEGDLRRTQKELDSVRHSVEAAHLILSNLEGQRLAAAKNEGQKYSPKLLIGGGAITAAAAAVLGVLEWLAARGSP